MIVNFLRGVIYAVLVNSPSIAAPKNPDNTLRIVADSMECDQQKNQCIADGNAFAEQPENDNKRTIRAEKFVAHFVKSDAQKKTEKEDSKNELSKLEAQGHVVITDKDNVIVCDRAIYDHPTETVELFDHVKITNDQNQLNGSYGHADLKTKKYRVTNDGSQVEGLFVDTKDSKKNSKKKKDPL
jgi:lipopolysaccharide export system protein LptA